VASRVVEGWRRTCERPGPGAMATIGGMNANGGQVSADEKEKAYTMAQHEMEYRVELFNKMTASCFEKCMDKRYKDGELNVGENSCVDRCASKYWQVTGIIGQMLGGAMSQGPPK